MPSNIQLELIDLKTHPSLKIKFDEHSSVPSASDMIKFWQTLPRENFPELRKFAQGFICRFGTTYRCEQTFSAMKLIKSKARSRLTFKFEECTAPLSNKLNSKNKKTGESKTAAKVS